ncbi:Hypothetical predicted protein [Octopus vulgaris]|uniref:Uncharacterized protein n=1 Tax=Octopus vulgaris TaxID=6645 RepID=A0AA36B1A6_OCTVU|nr:Hypothetical predicted protein [Octopus vulgaris]
MAAARASGEGGDGGGVITLAEDVPIVLMVVLTTYVSSQDSGGKEVSISVSSRSGHSNDGGDSQTSVKLAMLGLPCVSFIQYLEATNQIARFLSADLLSRFFLSDFAGNRFGALRVFAAYRPPRILTVFTVVVNPFFFEASQTK